MYVCRVIVVSSVKKLLAKTYYYIKEIIIYKLI